jgi:SAM-dependent methyltransferase
MDPSIYHTMASIEELHWWFRAKRKVLIHYIEKQILSQSTSDKRSYVSLDSGCGCGLMLKALNKYGKVTGIDFNEDAVNFSKKKFDCEVLQGDLTDTSFLKNRTFDLILCSDVLEHIEEDSKVINNLLKHLKPEGSLLLTVPAFMFLWSHHDVVHHHRKRYTKKNFEKLLKESDCQIPFISYYDFFLFPPILLIRLIQKIIPVQKLETDLRLPPFWLNKIVEKIFSVERFFISKKIQFPFGVSIIAHCKKGYHSNS